MMNERPKIQFEWFEPIVINPWNRSWINKWIYSSCMSWCKMLSSWKHIKSIGGLKFSHSLELNYYRPAQKNVADPKNRYSGSDYCFSGSDCGSDLIGSAICAGLSVVFSFPANGVGPKPTVSVVVTSKSTVKN